MSLYSIDKNGALGLPKRSRNPSRKAASFFENTFICLIVLLFGMASDAAFTYQCLDAFLFDYEFILALSLVSALIGMDVCPIYIGVMWKRRSEGYRISILALLMAVLVMIFSFGTYFLFRNAAAFMIMPTLDELAEGLAMDISASQYKWLTVCYTVFSCAFITATSIVNLVISYNTYNPTATLIRHEEDAIEQLNRKIAAYQALVKGIDNDPDRYRTMREEQQKQHDISIQKNHEAGMELAEFSNLRIAEKLKNPASTSALSVDQRETLEASFRRPAENTVRGNIGLSPTSVSSGD